MSSVLRIVADETAKASYDMLNSVVVRASRLNLGPGQANMQSGKQQSKSSLFGFTESATDFDFSRPATPAYSGTSREMTSGKDLWGSERSREISRSRTSTVHIPSPPNPGCSRTDQTSKTLLGADGSPVTQTLAELKQEAIRNRGKRKTKPAGRPKA